MTTTFNKTASSFQSLKNRLMAEFNRRDKNGSLANSSTAMTPTLSADTAV